MSDHIEIDGTDTVFATLGAGTRSGVFDEPGDILLQLCTPGCPQIKLVPHRPHVADSGIIWGEYQDIRPIKDKRRVHLPLARGGVSVFAYCPRDEIPERN
jgi:hypothetical protein